MGSYEAIASPQSLTVTRAADDLNDLNCTMASCTLRQAVNLSNATTGMGTNTITFASLFNTAQTITLDPTYGELQLTRDATITGPGSALLTVARSTTMGTPQFRIFQIAQLTPVIMASISGMTITGGDAGGGDGGGILGQGNLSLTDVAVRNSKAGNNGGGIEFNGASSVTLTLNTVTLSGNTAGQGGGLNLILGATLNATNLTSSGNAASSNGGGLALYGSATLTNATISGNSAIVFGGGIADGLGNVTTLTNVTVSGNSAPMGSGGGIHNNGGTLNATRSIIAGNMASDVNGGGINGMNVNNLTMGNPLLAPLGNYGGTTQTQPPLPGSPAIDTGGMGCSMTDQRGVMRPVNMLCDIGAVESQGFTFSMQTGSPQSTTKNSAFPTPLGLTVSSSHMEPVVGGVVTFTGPGSGAGITPNPTLATITGTAGASTGTVSQSVTGTGTSGTFTLVASAAGVPTAGNLSYALAIDTTVMSISRAMPLAQLTNATIVTYTVTFADPISNLTSGDFAVTIPMGSGVTNASVMSVAPMGTTPTATWTVTVNTGMGEGDLRLDYTSAANDAAPPVKNAPFITGDLYTIDRTPPTLMTMPSPLPAATFGQAYGPVTFTASDAHMPVITGAPGLPAGFMFTSGMGAIATLSGTPSSTTTLMFTVQAQDAAGNTLSQPYTITVNKATPAVSVTSSTMGASSVGQSVTFTATLTGVAGTAPTGMVSFTSSDGTPLAAQPLTAGMGATSTASVTTSALMAGMDTITATYVPGGDPNYLAGTPGTVVQTVGKLASSVVVLAAPTMAAQGVSITLTATVTGPIRSPVPTGSVSFLSGGTPLGMGTLDATGKASVLTTTLPVGMNASTASYSGDGRYAASTGMGSATVTSAAVTGLIASAPTGSGSGKRGTASMPKLAPGQSLTLTVTGSYTNGMMGSVSGVTYMSSDATKVTVDANGKIMALAPGVVTIIVTAPNGVMTTITVTVTSVSTGGLMNPNAQPMTRATAPATMAATPVPQPGTHPVGGCSVPQPQAAGTPTATPAAQPQRH